MECQNQMNVFSGSPVSKNCACERASRSELSRGGGPRRLSTFDHYYFLSISLWGEHEQSAYNIGDPGFVRQPFPPRKSNGRNRFLSVEHTRAYERRFEGA